MERPIRVLVVDDYEPWRRVVRSLLQSRPEVQIIGEVADGLEAVHKTQQLQPDLILLDIGLPTLNGIEAARRIRELSRKSKILFTSEDRFPEIVREALGTGAVGYLVKFDAVNDLLPAVEAVLQGKQFVSAGLASDDVMVNMDSQFVHDLPVEPAASERARPRTAGIPPRHEVAFCPDDQPLLDRFTQFAAAALTAGNAVIVIATEPHRDRLLRRLQAQGPDIAMAVKQGRYAALDAADMLSKFMRSGVPDPTRFSKLFRNVIETTAAVEKAHLAILGECTALLWAEGNREAAIQVEQFVNQLVKQYDVDILCGYSLAALQGQMDGDVFERICAEHSVICSP